MTDKQRLDAIKTARKKVNTVLADIEPEDDIYGDNVLRQAYIYLTKYIEREGEE